MDGLFLLCEVIIVNLEKRGPTEYGGPDNGVVVARVVVKQGEFSTYITLHTTLKVSMVLSKLCLFLTLPLSKIDYIYDIFFETFLLLTFDIHIFREPIKTIT